MSFAPNSLLEVARYALNCLPSVEEGEDSVRVVTNCLYPSNGMVSVTLRGGRNTFVVSDDGGAVEEASSAGAQVEHPDKQLRHLVAPHGLRIEGGVVFSSPVSLDRLPVAILTVANASQEVAHWLYEHVKIKRTYDFRPHLVSFLQQTFDRKLHHKELFVGASNTPRRFENVIFLDNQRRLIVDTVLNDQSSINSRVIANLDVKEAQYPNVEQRIVYDDAEDWAPSDLNLLHFGAPVVPFSKAPEVIRRVAQPVEAA